MKTPLTTSNITPAALFRSIGNPNLKTLLIDEGDAASFGNVKASERSEDLRSILNAGHTRKFAFVLRAPREGGDGEEVKRFSVWGPKAYAAIGKIPETVRSRSITIRMRRKPKNAKIERWRASKDPVGDDWKERAERIAQEKMSEFRQADVDPKELSFLNDREEDNCRELVKVADLTGGDWPQLARQAVRSMKMRSKPEDDIWGIYCWPTFGTCTRPNWRVRKSEERIHRITFFQRIWTNSCTISKKDPGATGRTGRESHPRHGEGS